MSSILLADEQINITKKELTRMAVYSYVVVKHCRIELVQIDKEFVDDCGC